MSRTFRKYPSEARERASITLMFYLYLTQKSLNQHYILEIYSSLFKTNFHNFLNLNKLQKSCQNSNYILSVTLASK